MAEHQLDPDIRAAIAAEEAKVAPKKWAKTIQRDDLKPCPFCGTKAIEQMRLANSETDMQFRISCGNPFCSVECRTPPMASKHNAEQAWQERNQ